MSCKNFVFHNFIMKNPKNIPKKRFDKLLTLIEFLKNRRVEIYTIHKSKHYVLEKNFSKKSVFSILKRNTSYYLFVTNYHHKKVIVILFCCIRCKNYFLHCALKCYTNENGITFQKIPIYFTEKD